MACPAAYAIYFASLNLRSPPSAHKGLQAQIKKSTDSPRYLPQKDLVQGSRPTRISTLVWAIELPQKTDRKSFLDRLDIIYLCSGTASSMLTRTASSIGYENVGTYTASFAGPKMDERSDAAKKTFSISPQESVVSEK